MKQFYLLIVGIVLTINPFFIAGIFALDIDRSFINVDYLLSILFFAHNFRKTAILTLFICVLIDVFCVVASIFTVYSIYDLLSLIRFATIENVNASYIIVLIVTIGILILTAVILSNYRKNFRLTKIQWVHVIAAISIMMLIDRAIVMIYDQRSQNIEWSHYSSNYLLSSQTFFLVKQLYFSDFFKQLKEINVEKNDLTPLDFQPASAPWFKKLPDTPNVLLINIESFGWINNESEQKQMFPAFEALKNNINIEVVSTGKTMFRGVTINAEIRELCNAIIPHMLVAQTNVASWDCLPRQFNKAGYQTISLNVASRSMYFAGQWYPMTGLETNYFLENMPNPGRCYSWPGGCDANYFQLLNQLFSTQSKHFIYWLTANSHFPYDERDADNFDYDCKQLTINDKQLCNYIRIQNKFFHNLEVFIDKNKEKDIEIILVGDHQPPFFNKKVSDLFSSQVVPYLHLKIKNKES